MSGACVRPCVRVCVCGWLRVMFGWVGAWFVEGTGTTAAAPTTTVAAAAVATGATAATTSITAVTAAKL